MVETRLLSPAAAYEISNSHLLVRDFRVVPCRFEHDLRSSDLAFRAAALTLQRFDNATWRNSA